MKGKKITIFNPKGGVGKTALAINLALELRAGIITNDAQTIVTSIFERKRALLLDQGENLPTLPEYFSVVYDFGGYLDHRVEAALKASDYFIIPFLPYPQDFQHLADFFEEMNMWIGDEIKIMLVLNNANRRQWDEERAFFYEH